MYLNILSLPLLAFLTVSFMGIKLGVRGSQIITSLSIIISGIIALFGFYSIVLNNTEGSMKIYITSWMNSIGVNADWGFYFDSISISMCLMVLIISSCVHIYSINYMAGDPHIQRFFAYLSLFTFFMLVLVCSNNYLTMFVGWEGIGICSYLLINFWFTRVQANKAAIQAIMMNRIGDLGFLLGLFGLSWTLGTSDLKIISIMSPSLVTEYVTLLTLVLLIAAIGKSAQLGLHTWLPSAMEGPTPVSALIHAATLVTAGVYLILRAAPLFEVAPTSLICVCIIGSLTAIFAAIIGLTQYDIKKIIAYSTMSQVGYMVFTLGLSQYELAFFHLFNHAFFKALLFLSAGSIIHALHSEQDLRKMGGLVNLLPFTYTMLLIGSLSLMALPFLTGYYSKDSILEMAYSQWLITGTFTYWLGTITAILTAYYTSKTLILGFLNKPNGSLKIYNKLHDAPIFMAIPLIILAILSIFIGYYMKEYLAILGINTWGILESITGRTYNWTGLDIEWLSSQFSIQLYPLFASILGIISAMSFFIFSPSLLSSFFSSSSPSLIKLQQSVTFITLQAFRLLFSGFTSHGCLHLGGIFVNSIDKGFLERFLSRSLQTRDVVPFGSDGIFLSISKFLAINIETGFIPHYASLLIIIPIICYIGTATW